VETCSARTGKTDKSRGTEQDRALLGMTRRGHGTKVRYKLRSDVTMFPISTCDVCDKATALHSAGLTNIIRNTSKFCNMTSSAVAISATSLPGCLTSHAHWLSLVSYTPRHIQIVKVYTPKVILKTIVVRFSA
jgi:hypothetical protein